MNRVQKHTLKYLRKFEMYEIQNTLWILVLLFAATCPATSMYYDGIIDQKWSMTSIIAIAFVIFTSFNRRKPIINKAFEFSSVATILYLCIYCIIQSHFFKTTSITGPFENANVLSLHLCLLLPFLHKKVQIANGKIRPLMISFELLVVYFILLTSCRTGWICLSLFLLLSLLKGKWKLLIIPFSLFLVIFLSSVFKKDSSHGRSLIIHNTIELVKEAPLLGHGLNGFSHKYMSKQSEFFVNNHDKELEMLADNISHPLNEFLLIAVNHGIIGAFLFLLIFLVPLIYKNRLYCQNYPLWLSLLTLSIFCLFSYPLLYPMSWIIIIYSWGYMLKNAIVGIFDSHRKTIRFCAASSFVILIAYSTLLLCWGYASNQAVRGKSQKAMVIYSQLYPYLSWRGIFLYDYSIESLYAGKYKQAYKIAEECRKKNLTYDLALMEGDICRCLNKYDDALRFFNEASYMCPVRFAPLHGKWQVYNQLRDYERADSMAHIIKHKDIKVYSADIKEIISEINKCTYH